MNYDKQDARMTRGFAILCMITLHLFCRTGDDVFGTPLIWLNSTTPLVFLFGFFAEICVPLYSLCAGYARYLLSYKQHSTIKRILRLMVNYWIVVVLFSIMGLIFDPGGMMPGTFVTFIKSLFLLHSYNGAWWYLHTYVILLLIPTRLLLLPVQKLTTGIGLAFCLLFEIAWYLVGHFGLWPAEDGGLFWISFFWTELGNLVGILAFFWAGAFLCKAQAIPRLYRYVNTHLPKRLVKPGLMIFAGCLFAAYNIAHKAILVGITAVLMFLIFNIWEKSEYTKQVFEFLGRHSTNIWLTHMFFYAYIFKNLVFCVKYPLLILLFLLILCVITSYIIMIIETIVRKVWSRTAMSKQLI